MSRRAYSGQGFTLIEVLVGLALLALVLSLVGGVYTGVTRSRDRLLEDAEGAHAAAMLLARISDELAAAVVPESSTGQAATHFSVTVDGDGSSRLEFSTPLSNSLQAEPGREEQGREEQGGLARIAYSLEKEGDGSLTLMRAETEDPDADLQTGVEPDPVMRGVVRFRVLCSLDGKTWEDKWDSAARSAADSLLPKVVAVEIAWKDPGRESEPPRVLRTEIPVYGALG